jgi:xanthine dehydrogenase YagS FAD-binding subunit
MRGFNFYSVTTVPQAISLLTQHQGKAALLAGGSDMFTLMKDRVEGPKMKVPQHLLDISGIKDLHGIRVEKNELRIGAMTTLADIASSPHIADQHPLLSQAADQIAVPQIRNVGTLGGNLCQRPRCWYFRGKLFKDCLRKGGENCYAMTGENQNHAIFPADNCCMVCPSDMATALVATGASVEIATPREKKLIPVEQFYLRPGENPFRETILAPADMVLSVIIPSPVPGSKGIYLKLKEREAFDFAIVSVAAVVTFKADVVSAASIALGGVGPMPLRATDAEAALKGKKLRDGLATACAASVKEASPLSSNGYKVMAVKGLLEKALTSLA